MNRTSLRRFGFLWLSVAFAGCSASHAGISPAGAQAGSVMPPAGVVALPTSAKIQHVIIIVQEARSFDNLFCGYPGADTAKCSSPSIPLEAKCTIFDRFEDFERDRKTGEFSHERTDCPGYTRPEYLTVPSQETRPYRTIATWYFWRSRGFVPQSGD